VGILLEALVHREQHPASAVALIVLFLAQSGQAFRYCRRARLCMTMLRYHFARRPSALRMYPGLPHIGRSAAETERRASAVTESCRGTTETRKIERPLAFVTLRRI
jgi:hypothetical protein